MEAPHPVMLILTYTAPSRFMNKGVTHGMHGPLAELVDVVQELRKKLKKL